MTELRPSRRLPASQSSFEHSHIASLRTSSPTQNSLDQSASLAARRRSAVNKVPQGPRPQDANARPKRSAGSSETLSASDLPGYVPNAVSEPFLGLSARKDSLAAARPPPKSLSTMSLQPPSLNARRHNASPSVDFDSVHDNAAAAAPPTTYHAPRQSSLHDITRPTKATAARKSMTLNTPLPFDPPTNPAINLPPADAHGRRTSSLSASVHPPQSMDSAKQKALQAARAAQLSAGAPPPAVPSTARSRRQSQFPPSSAGPVASIDAKQPRKSVGPGLSLLGRDKHARDSSISNASEAGSIGGVSLSRQVSANQAKDLAFHTRDSSTATGADSLAAPLLATRKIKAVSMQPSPRSQSVAVPASIVKQSSKPWNSTSTTAETPPSTARRRPNTPGHMGGLGARTISPTDARRIKRSSAAAPPPIPVARTPSPEVKVPQRSGRTPPPSTPKRKSMTPVSNRATPDAAQKLDSYRPTSSRSSYTSCRPVSSSMGTRSPAGNPTTSATRNLHSSSGPAEGENVPPVPKIPMEYESPGDTMEKPFFADLSFSSSLPSEGIHMPFTLSKDAPKVAAENGAKAAAASREQRQARRLTLGSRPDSSKQSLQHRSQPSLNAPRLPPLNLNPLSDTTDAKIAELSKRAPASSVNLTNGGNMTPPLKRNVAKTPSTPMTASKATFPSRELHFPPDAGTLSKIRSTTSQTNSRPPSHNVDSSRSDSTDPSVASKDISARSRSPSSSSAFMRARAWSKSRRESKVGRPRSKDPSSHQMEGPESGLMGRLSRNATKSTRNSQMPPPHPSSAEIDSKEKASTTGPAIRRKLSLGWRRSSSKASNGIQIVADDESRGGMVTSDMAPPRIPTSSSVRPSPRLSLSSDGSKIPSLSTGIPDVGSSASLLSSHATKSTRLGTATQEPTPSVMRSTSGFLTPMQRILGPRSSSHNTSKVSLATSAVQSLDKGDLAAEDEMRKLASKKKEMEASAREVDELRKRATPRSAMSGSQANKAGTLTLFERGEIIDFPEVFFAGNSSAHKHHGDLAAQSQNFGYDDERGDYNIVFGDHLAYRYEVVNLLGKGSFGQVVRCIDHKLGKLVAIKIIRNKKRFHQQALVEVNILQKIKDWDPEGKHSMINFTQNFYFRGHLCISTELLGSNLYEFIRSHEFSGFSIKLIRRFAKQMLSCLCLLQVKNVIHCDLKPENILLAHPMHSEIKVIDFGSSCFEHEKVYTYIQSRFYRSPEVILGMTYGMPIDMWSFGCILAELKTGYPIFPGENEPEQLACIMEIFGPPEKHMVERSTRKKIFFDTMGKPRPTVSSKGKRRRPSSKTLQQALKCEDEAFLDFLSKCLRWDPERRMKPDEAMQHEFITGIKKPAVSMRSRGQPSGSSRANSPVKRSAVMNSTPQQPRPLPDTPVTSFKNGVAMPHTMNNLYDLPSSHSPAKTGSISSASTIAAGSSRRHSALLATPSTGSIKRTSAGVQAVNSGLPRAGPGRSVSGKPDLASAAAIASLKMK